MQNKKRFDGHKNALLGLRPLPMLASLLLLLVACATSSPIINPNDTTPPSIALIPTANNLTAPTSTKLTVNATDNVGVARVDLIENTQVIQSLSAQPYQFTLNYTNANLGDHNYIAKAFDASGNSSTSGNLKITVNAQTSSAAVSFVGTGQDYVGYNENPFVLGKPSQVLAGDLMLAFVIINSDQDILSAPTGWTPLSQLPVFGGGPGIQGVYIFKHYASANEGSSYSFSRSLTNPIITRGVILAYRGANTVLEAHTLDSVRDHPVVIPNLVTTVNGCTILRVGSVEPVNHERKLVSNDLTPRYDTGLTLYSTLYIGEELQASAGATGTRTMITQSDLIGRFDEGFSSFTLALCP